MVRANLSFQNRHLGLWEPQAPDRKYPLPDSTCADQKLGATVHSNIAGAEDQKHRAQEPPQSRHHCRVTKLHIDRQLNGCYYAAQLSWQALVEKKCNAKIEQASHLILGSLTTASVIYVTSFALKLYLALEEVHCFLQSAGSAKICGSSSTRPSNPWPYREQWHRH